MYPEKMIFDVAGFPAIKGRELVANLVEQAGQYNPKYLLGVRADKLSYAEDGRPVLTLSDGETLTCGAVLITGGLGSFTSRPLPAADVFTGDGVMFFVKQLDELAGHDVVIVGGGDSAFDWALALQPLAKSVTLDPPAGQVPGPRRDRGAGAGAARRDHRERRGHQDHRRQPGQRVRGRGQGRRAAGLARRHRGGRARLHRRPRTAGRVGTRRSTSATSWLTRPPPPTCPGSSPPATSPSTRARYA